MMRIYQEIALYGTSEKRLNLKRGIQKIRDFMMPEPHQTSSTTLLRRKLSSKEALSNVPDRFMVESGSNFHKFWALIIIFLLLYTATVMPYKIALIEDDMKDPLYYIDTIVDFIFMLDIIINFNMPIEQKFKPEPDYNRRRIAVSYFTFWFWIDITASIPLNLIMDMTITSDKNVDLSG